MAPAAFRGIFREFPGFKNPAFSLAPSRPPNSAPAARAPLWGHGRQIVSIWVATPAWKSADFRHAPDWPPGAPDVSPRILQGFRYCGNSGFGGLRGDPTDAKLGDRNTAPATGAPPARRVRFRIPLRSAGSAFFKRESRPKRLI